jgi:hypothetical protein
MRFMVFSVGLSVRFDNARRQQRANVQDKKRAKQDTGADGAREKTHIYFLSIVAPADGIKAAKLRKRRLRYITVLRAALSQATACLSSE